MPFGGDKLEPHQIAELLWNAGWRDFDLVEMTATILGESQGYTKAYNDNVESGSPVKPLKIRRGDRVLLPEATLNGAPVLDRGKVHVISGINRRKRVAKIEDGRLFNFVELRRVKSRDIGLAQINVPASAIGNHRERSLYDPVTNIRAARKLFDTRETLTRRRRFNPWYAYTVGWATFPEWWVFRSKEAAEAKGLPREWVPTGRYLHQAIVGVANFHANKFGVSYLELELNDEPQRPRRKPDGDGPRPKRNRGRGILG